MKGLCLRIYTTEQRRHDGMLLFEWLLEQARAAGIPGASVLRAVAGYGRHARIHEETFFELAGELPVEIEFVADQAPIRALLARIDSEQLGLFYVLGEVDYGVTAGAAGR